jgi:hypothetical protein
MDSGYLKAVCQELLLSGIAGSWKLEELNDTILFLNSKE